MRNNTEDVAESLGLESSFGAIVSVVVEDSPAEAAGILPGDIIIEFNDEVIEEMRELPKVVANTGVDQNVPVVVLRDGERLSLTLETGELETDGSEAAGLDPVEPETPETPEVEDRILGMVLVPLDDGLRQQFEISEDIEGVLVEKIIVIGVNTMIFSPTGTNIGIGFAIPSNQVQRVVEQLIEFGRTKRGWIGVTIQSVTEDVAESLGLESSFGAIVSVVVEDSPAEAAGILPGDIIIEFNDEVIEEMRELPKVVANTGVDQNVPVVVLRDGERLSLTLETGELETDGSEAAGLDPVEPETPETPEVEDRILGMVLVPLDDGLRQQFEISEDIEGVLVENLSRNSEAAIRGVRPGDVIVQVNLRNVENVREIETAIEGARRLGRSTVLFRIYREGSYFHVPIPTGEDE